MVAGACLCKEQRGCILTARGTQEYLARLSAPKLSVHVGDRVGSV